MSHFSISDSKIFTRKRLYREVGRFFLLLLCLESFCRWEPIRTYLSNTFDRYENLLWYDPALPSYKAQLEDQPGYAVWLVGSSYVMSGLSPQLVQNRLHEQGIKDNTVQNYGMNRMVNLEVMSQVFDRWLLNLDQPSYIVVATSQRNFTVASYEPSDIMFSPYESMYIFPQSLDDYIRGFLFKNSTFYHYGILAHNALLIPPEQTVRDPLPQGGYVERTQTTDCNELEDKKRLVNDMEGGLSRLDHFLDVVEEHHISVLVVNLPLPSCTITYQGFANYDDYWIHYLQPLAKHLQDRNIPFSELDTRFQREIPEDTQQNYFIDAAHANKNGAALFSQWTADFIFENANS